MGLKSDLTCNRPNCPKLNCSFYFFHFRNQNARFFFPLYPLCTFLRWALRTATIDQPKPPPLPRRRHFSGVDGRLWSSESSACQAVEERKEKLVVLSLPAASFHPLPGIHTVHQAHFGLRPPLCFPRFTHSSRHQHASPHPPKKSHHDSLMRQWSATPTRPSYPPCLPRAPPRQCVLENSQNHRLLYLHPLAPSFIIILCSLHERCSLGCPAVITVIHVYASRHWNA